MGFRDTICATTAAFTVALAAAGATPAAAATTCTWGGTPDHPTGVTVQRPGLTNTPAPGPIEFRATGPLAGGAGCVGKFTFIGRVNPGSTCALVTFQGRAIGIPGVARFAGVSAAGLAPARLYDKHGAVVGSENAQFLTGANATDCNTPEGMTGNHFSSVIVLKDDGARSRTRTHRRWNSFDGSCKLSGELRFDTPVNSEPREVTFTDTARGTCTGSLNGAPQREIPVVNLVKGAGTLSCAGGLTMTSDTLIFDRRTRIDLSTTAAGAVAEFAGHFEGARSGGGVVEVNLLPYFDPSVIAACQDGALRSVRYDLMARTVTPMVG
jgi:hypothetical protein